jgi:hypothetical protein
MRKDGCGAKEERTRGQDAKHRVYELNLPRRLDFAASSETPARREEM